MSLPPFEDERRAWIEAWMHGAHAEFESRAVHVRQALKMTPKDCREILVAALRAMHLTDLASPTGAPTLHESDASADFTRYLKTPRKLKP